MGIKQAFQGQAGQSQRLPAGTYTVLADGSGLLIVGTSYLDGTSDSNQFITFTNGVVTSGSANIVVSKTVNQISVTLGNAFGSTVNSVQGNPLRNIQIIMPDRAGFQDGFLDTYQQNRGIVNKNFFLFHPDFLNSLSPFSCLRFMDLFFTNNTSAASWSNRPLPGWRYGPDQAWGPPQEVAAYLLTMTLKDGWVNVPHLFDDASVTSMAQLWRDNAPSTSKIFVEYSNECWNSVFTQYSHCICMGCQEFNNEHSFESNIRHIS